MVTQLPRRLKWIMRGPRHLMGVIRLAITEKRKTCLYRYFVRPIPSDFGFAMEWHSLPYDDSPCETYQVCVENAQDGYCSCPGFERYGKCKHVEATRAILAKEGAGA